MRPLDDLSLGVLADVFAAAPDIAVNLLSKDYKVLWANGVMAALVECSLNDMLGRPCYEVWRRRESPCPVCLLKIVSETKRPYMAERWLDLPNKERRFGEVRAYPVFNRRGLVERVFEIIIPISDRKRDEERHSRYVTSLEDALRSLNASRTADFRGRLEGESCANLTPREQEVLRLVIRGFSNREIAQVLAISRHTVKTHINNIFSKLTVRDRAQAAAWAVSHGLG